MREPPLHIPFVRFAIAQLTIGRWHFSNAAPLRIWVMVRFSAISARPIWTRQNRLSPLTLRRAKCLLRAGLSPITNHHSQITSHPPRAEPHFTKRSGTRRPPLLTKLRRRQPRHAGANRRRWRETPFGIRRRLKIDA